jgi:hypothetical protein
MPLENSTPAEQPSATETAIANLGADAPAPASPTSPEPSPPASPEAKPADKPEGVTTPAHEGIDQPRHSEKMTALLAELSEPDPNAAPADKPEPKPKDKPATPTGPDDKPTPPNEEAELLEGVRSDRGRQRIQQVFAEKKALERDVGEFREMITGTGMNPQQFAQSLEYGRLVNAGDEASIRVALEMVEAQRKTLYAQLGVEAPGVDLLAEHADLKTAVEDMEITRERAVELAKLRRGEQQRQQREKASQAQAQSQQAYQQTVANASTTLEAYLNSRAGEVDHPARIKALTDHFSNPENMQKFVSNYRPEQWLDTVQMLYDNVAVAPQRSGSTQQPIRSRPSVLGQAAVTGETPAERMARRLDDMGI